VFNSDVLIDSIAYWRKKCTFFSSVHQCLFENFSASR